MHECVQALNSLKIKIREIVNKTQLKTTPKIIAVTKTFSVNKFIPLIELGHIHYGENKIQEAEDKWIDLKKKYKNLQLHMVGKLQSNKVKKAIKLFDYIHSLDNEKIALKINQYVKELNKNTKLFIQVNIADENLKSGISLNNVNKFYNYCTKDLSLNVIGLMTMPPINDDPNKHFSILKNKSKELNLHELSMGMSADYEKAIENESTYLRLGTALFGNRNI